MNRLVNKMNGKTFPTVLKRIRTAKQSGADSQRAYLEDMIGIAVKCSQAKANLPLFALRQFLGNELMNEDD